MVVCACEMDTHALAAPHAAVMFANKRIGAVCSFGEGREEAGVDRSSLLMMVLLLLQL